LGIIEYILLNIIEYILLIIEYILLNVFMYVFYAPCIVAERRIKENRLGLSPEKVAGR
jgi:hypothetical protein